MATLSEKLELLISVNTQGAVSQLESLAKGTEKATQSATSNLQKYQSAAKTAFGLGAAGMGAGLLLTQLGSKEEAASNQLKAAIQQVGQSYSDFGDKIEEAAGKQAEFGNTNAEAKAAVTTLTIAYGDTGKALDEMQLVTDLAARKHIDLADAATMVAKAHGGAGRVFKEFGITVQKGADGTKDFDGALSELAQKLTGQASASAETFNGKLAMLKAEAENLASAFGEKFGPAILGVSTILTTVGAGTTAVLGIMVKRAAATDAAAASAAADAAALEAETAAMSAFAAANAGAIAAVEGNATAVSVLSGEIAGLTTNSSASVGSLYAMSAAEEKASTAAVGFGSALGALAIGAGIGAVIYAIGDALGQIPDAGKDATTAIKALSTLAGGEALQKFNSLDSYTKAITFAELRDGGAQGVGVLIKLRDAAKAAGEDTKVYDDAIQQAQTSQAGMTETTKAGQAALQDTSGFDAQKEAAKQFEDELKNLQQVAKDTQKTYEDTLSAYNRLLPAEMQVERGPDQIASANANVDEAAKKLADAQAGTPADTQKQNEANVALAKAQADLADAQKKGDAIAAQDAQNRIDKAQADQAAAAGSGPDPAKVAAAQRDYNDAVRSAESAVNDYAQAQADLQVTQDAANGKVDTAAEKAYFYRSALGDTTDSLNGPVHDALMAHIADLDAAAAATAFLAAIAYHSALEAAAAAGDDNARIALNQGATQRQQDTGDYATGGHRASGGDVQGGLTYRVNENQQEFLTLGPRMSGHVWTPQQMAAQSAGGNGGSTHIENHIYEAQNARATAYELSTMLDIKSMLAAA